MAYKIIGNVLIVGQTEHKPTKTGGVFTSRSLTLMQKRYDPNTGEEFEPNYPQFNFTGNSCSQLDNLKAGDRVQVSFEVSGVKYNDRQTGEEKYFTTLRAFKCEPYVQPIQQTKQPAYNAQPQQQFRPQQAAAPQQQYAPAQSPAWGGQSQQGGYPQNQPRQAQQQYDQYGNPLGEDGLPFNYGGRQ
ncbi:MAG: DUF3127 domain-containing protein [Prevotella sp.]|nr:DUF3127 domain-containing protein [Prevotella sp.]